MTRLILAILGFAYAAPIASGQQRTDSDDCASAVRLVASGEATITHAGWALGHVVRCPDGPAAIAARWRAATGAPADLQQLRAWTLQIQDQRIADAVLATARSQRAPTIVRLAALETLVQYFDPGRTIDWGILQNPPSTGGSIGYISDVAPRVGKEPPLATLRGTIYEAVRDLASDADPTLARAARYTWQGLTDAWPDIASLLPNTLTLEWLCGAKYRITNHSAIDLSLDVTSAPGTPGQSLRLPAHESREIVVADSGIVHVSLSGGRELASNQTGGRKCP